MLAYRDLTKEQLEEELLKQKEAYKRYVQKILALTCPEENRDLTS